MKDNSTKDKINKLLKELFALAKHKFTDVKLKDGSILRTPDDTLIKGSKVVIVSPEGVESAAPEGDVTSDDGSTITIKSGVVDNLAQAAANVPIEDTAAVPANKAMKIPAQEAKMDATAVAVPANPDAAGDAATDIDSQVDGMDMVGLIELIKNIVERVSALEAPEEDPTVMAAQKMSAAPAEKPFNFDPFKEGTIGSELFKYKENHKTNQARIEKQLLELSKKRMAPVKINKAENFATQTPSVMNINKPKRGISLGGSFSIDAA